MPDYIQKEARLFRAGSYPGKIPGKADFTVTVDDLRRIMAGTTHAPLIHAHDEKNERLDYGVIDPSSLNIRGNELWGNLSLFPDAVPFLERNGIKGLSIAIPEDKSRLKEVSMTRKPTVMDAVWFSETAPETLWFTFSDEPNVAEFTHNGFDYSSTHFPLPADIAEHIKTFASAIPDEHLSEDGREIDPHITLKYGLHTQDSRKVLNAMEGASAVPVTFGKTSVFAGSDTDKDYDVIKVDANSPEIQAANKSISSKLAHVDTHAEYHPHATIAYVKAGHGEKYAGKDFLDGKTASLDRLIFSNRDGEKTEIPLATNQPTQTTFSDQSETADERKTKMGFWDKLLGKEDATDAEKNQAKAEFHEAIKEAIPAPADTTAQFSAMQKRIEEQDAQLFAQRMLTTGRILPTQVQTVIAEFSEAAEDDRLAPRVVTFSLGTDNKQGSRVDRVKAKYETAQPNRLTEELLPDGNYSALFNRESSTETTEQKETRIAKQVNDTLAQTELGRRALANRNGKS